MSEKIIYVDNNATTCVAPEVFEAMGPFLTEYYGNPSSAYGFSGIPAKAIRESREAMADLLGADEDEIIFTSCGSESDNAVISSALQTQKGRRKIVTTAVEHPAVLNVCRNLQKQGVEVEYLGVDRYGRLNLDEAECAITDDTALVTVMTANNEIGNIYPIAQLAAIAHKHGALFHTDAVQAVGKIPFNLKESEIDFLSLSGHKFHAPKGVGVLYRKRFTPFVSFLQGGHQEKSQRAGTENVAGIVGLGVAARLAKDNMVEENTRVRALRDKLELGLLRSCPDPAVNGDVEHRLPNTTSICFKYIEGESILLRLYHLGRICASSGSACTTGSLEPSHVLKAMGLDYQALHGSIRFSLSRYNTEAEIDKLLEIVPPVIKALRDLSPFGRQK